MAELPAHTDSHGDGDYFKCEFEGYCKTYKKDQDLENHYKGFHCPKCPLCLHQIGPKDYVDHLKEREDAVKANLELVSS